MDIIVFICLIFSTVKPTEPDAYVFKSEVSCQAEARWANAKGRGDVVAYCIERKLED